MLLGGVHLDVHSRDALDELGVGQQALYALLVTKHVRHCLNALALHCALDGRTGKALFDIGVLQDAHHLSAIVERQGGWVHLYVCVCDIAYIHICVLHAHTEVNWYEKKRFHSYILVSHQRK